MRIGTKVEREASVSSVQVNLAAELIDLLPDRQGGWISQAVVSLHMQLGLGRNGEMFGLCVEE